MIYELKKTSYAYPHLDIQAKVGKGTYIRALARDIGQDLGVGGYLEELVRYQVGPFNLDDAHEIGTISAANIGNELIPPEIAIEDEFKTQASEHDIERLAHGESIPAPNNFAGSPDIPFMAVIDKQGKLLILAEYSSNKHEIKSRKIFDIKLRR